MCAKNTYDQKLVFKRMETPVVVLYSLCLCVYNNIIHILYFVCFSLDILFPMKTSVKP